MPTSAILLLLLVAPLLARATAVPSTDGAAEARAQFEQFKLTYDKHYGSAAEEARRFGVFAANVAFVNAHNADPTASYKMAINRFSDMSAAEFEAAYLRPVRSASTDDDDSYGNDDASGSDDDYYGYEQRRDERERRGHHKRSSTTTISTLSSINWRNRGAVTPVKNQGANCTNGGWAFAATGVMETVYFLSTGNLPSMSEQELFDCSSSYGNDGCAGGSVDAAFEYAIAHGMNAESDYPYLGYTETCQNLTARWHPITGFAKVPRHSPLEFAAAVDRQPVAVNLDASGLAFQHYSSGIFTGPCKKHPNHAMLVVGYTETYYIVKNSLGTSWGEQGYIYMSRTVDHHEGLCGMLKDASYAFYEPTP